MYLFSCVEREKKLYLERHSMSITCISRDIDICTYFYVLREREKIYCIIICVYIYMYLFPCFWIESVFDSIPKPIPYYCLSL